MARGHDATVDRTDRAAHPRVAIVDDHLLFSQAMTIALQVSGSEVLRLAVPAEPGLLSTVAEAAARFHPDVVLVDLDLGRAGDGVLLIRELTEREIPVLVLTGSPERHRWGAALYQGAASVIEKTRPLDEILETIRLVCAGEPTMPDGERHALTRRWVDREREQRGLRERLGRLTEGERAVLTQLTMGRTVSEIATIRTVSEATVRTQVKSVLAKLEVSSQIAAVGIAHRAGWRPRGAPPPGSADGSRHADPRER